MQVFSGVLGTQIGSLESEKIIIMSLDSKQTLALWQASEESACFLLSFFCDY